MGDARILADVVGLGGCHEDQLCRRGDVLDESQAPHGVSMQHHRLRLDLFRDGQGVGEKQPGQPHLGRGRRHAALLTVAPGYQQAPRLRGGAGRQHELHECAVAQRAGDLGEEQHVLVGIRVAAHDQEEEVDGVAVAGVPGYAGPAAADGDLDALEGRQPRMGNGDARCDPRAHDFFPVSHRRDDDLGFQAVPAGGQHRRQLADRPVPGAAAQGHDPRRQQIAGEKGHLTCLREKV